MLNVKEITDTDDLKQLHSVWNHLLSESSSDNIFLTWEWVFNWWQAYGYDKKLRVLVLQDNNEEMIAIAPLYARRKKILKGFLINELRFLGSGEDVSPDYLDFIIKKSREEDSIKSFLNHLSGEDRWDVLNLTDMLSTSHTVEIFKKVAMGNGLIVKLSECAICPYIQLPSSWDEYIEGLSTNMRYNVRRRMRNLEKKFDTKFFVWKDIEKLEYAMEKLSFLHNKRWEEKRTRHSFSTKEYNTFHLAVARDFVLKGWLHLSCLELDGEIAGMLYDYRYKNKMFYYQGGFDPELYKYSLGLVLRAYVIQKAIEDGIEEIDLLKGGYEHKYKWTESDRHTLNLIISRNTFGGKLFFFNAFRIPQMKTALRKALPNSFLKLIKK